MTFSSKASKQAKNLSLSNKKALIHSSVACFEAPQMTF